MQRWTIIEKRRALELIELNNHNLCKAFRQFAQESGRSVRAITNAWYNPSGALYNYRKEGFIFTTIGKKIELSTPVKYRRRIYRFIKDWFRK